MKFYDKLIALRREKGLSQEQLADLLGVSRQAVSKWESGGAMPEMEKLIIISDLFGVSVDYLVRENVTQREQDKTVVTAQDNVAVMEELTEIKRTLHGQRSGLWRDYEYEYKSKAHIGKVPLVHVHFKPYGFTTAKGIIALGNVAVGVVALGGISVGVLSLGGVGLGLLALGGGAFGGLALGGVAVGGLALGGIAVGVFAAGGMAVGSIAALGGFAVGGELAVGGQAIGRVAVGDIVQGTYPIRVQNGVPDASAVRKLILEYANLPQFLRAMISSGIR